MAYAAQPAAGGPFVSYILVALGGAVGAALRHGVNRIALAQLGSGFPYGTLIVNVAGGFLMGFAAAMLMDRAGSSDGWRFFLITGVLGGFTTFSAFSLEAAQYWQRGDYIWLCGYVGASVVLSIGALFAGVALAQAIAPLR